FLSFSDSSHLYLVSLLILLLRLLPPPRSTPFPYTDALPISRDLLLPLGHALRDDRCGVQLGRLGRLQPPGWATCLGRIRSATRSCRRDRRGTLNTASRSVSETELVNESPRGGIVNRRDRTQPQTPQPTAPHEHEWVPGSTGLGERREPGTPPR